MRTLYSRIFLGDVVEDFAPDFMDTLVLVDFFDGVFVEVAPDFFDDLDFEEDFELEVFLVPFDSSVLSVFFFDGSA